ncbi:TetR/AcrR family transcriptional regulator [Agromyces atrinae]|uniref:TetR/AcrR family transcriptional regulator n=1 Tax=Agromyces atrinae TaxID=592376 RepID=UPI001F569589|nr:TetR/AcrR family transcriptional regulator [Agromyces atrinae]MCI2956690.1 TetR/AcrR family transcriptional regulator [Agromyces atrinae]
MNAPQIVSGRRERAKEDKRRRIMTAARELFARHGVGGVTTQQIADEADVAIGTLFLYASSKAELLIMVQNQKFEAAIDEGLRAADDAASAAHSAVDIVVALIEPVVACIREQPENGRIYLHELVFGDPTEPNRGDGLALSMRLEGGLVGALTRGGAIAQGDAEIMARVITAVIHVTTTATIYLERSPAEILADIRRQIEVLVAR